MNENRLAKNIVYYCKKKGLSQEKVSEYMGVSSQDVTKWENNVYRLNANNLCCRRTRDHFKFRVNSKADIRHINSYKGQSRFLNRSGLNEIAFNISIRKLMIKGFVETSIEHDYKGNEYNGLIITDKGNDCILKNEDKFSYEYILDSNSKTNDGFLPFC